MTLFSFRQGPPENRISSRDKVKKENQKDEESKKEE